ncbi:MULTISPECIES: trimethylamine N-oxide reductase system protein TorE [unclassified Agarivorans]|uniref:trimethylamine N-oxide reductase system protein TorE n=1 Tax=unclassified Agarivorans TaxID=2636026 RepID=UPI0010EAB97A|nr:MULTISPECIES: trimethylamine N-oxide reductase system protein TorE [unclassified Agarivorans]MDO6687841.1 trimethylamine N-oxide reductase system protein TorE [Agarivorans sp. 3_MG-2023]MDO6717463.1 trimethylamine N-oxide reductase system protein TorE [Agarivorans sp. 2_MG-2023]MDO6763187.1 trimethylamine N-oxide reductase system protein TorE [Agarivorans sp. 1_MG-2023]GDY27028.1 trimethylamine N-oxide reductase system protein TorE [Agarivorans sp. Toyoura001]
MSSNNVVDDKPSKSDEWKVFLFIAVILFPILAVAFVGGYGFIVWMLQILTGPPGHG